MSSALHLFDAVGVEVEYAIVDPTTLRVRPISDWLLETAAGRLVSEVELGRISWSNELVLHIIEFKTSEPTRDLTRLARDLTENVARANRWLAGSNARLCPTAMHPLMDPTTETHLWPHTDAEIYLAFDRIFDCRGHGWSNLQSVHINLPFAGDLEFSKLHAAIRVLLPLLPMLAASSPLVGGVPTGLLDNRLEYYRRNCRRIPAVTGRVVPEPVETQGDYQRDILQPIADAIAPLDPGGVLEPIWVNSRGAIARPDRGSIEIRLIDTQECASADVAIVAAVWGLARALVEGRWAGEQAERAITTDLLVSLLGRAIVDGSRALVDDAKFLSVLGMSSQPRSGAELWAEIIERLRGDGLLAPAPKWRAALSVITEQGCLASRIAKALARTQGTRDDIVALYLELADCLARDAMFEVR